MAFPRPPRGLTLVEMLIVLVIIAIAAAIAVPLAGTTSATTLTMAARMLVADIEFAQDESIAHPADTRLIKAGEASDRYWIAKASDVDTAIDDPAGTGQFLVQFGSGRAAMLGGVTISSYSLGGDTELHFDAFGVPDQTTDGTITLACDGRTITITILAGSGEVTVQTP